MKNTVKYALVTAMSAMLFITGCTRINENAENSDTISYIAPETSAQNILTDASDTINSQASVSPASDYTVSSDSSTTASDTEAIQTKPTEEDKNEFPFTLLTDNEKKYYNELYSAVYRYSPEADFSGELSESEMKRLFLLFYNQESRVFWLDSLFYPPENKHALKLTYRFEKDKADLLRAELNLAASTLLGSIPENASDYDKLKCFHDYIVSHCDFSRDTEYSNTPYGALVDGKAQCEGYAFAFSYLCDEAKIKNYVVTGTRSDGATHAWNKVLADGEWYNVDCTWDDPILKHNDPDFIRHDYFLVPDRLTEGITHFTDKTVFTPIECSSEKLNYFVKENLMFSSADSGIDEMKKLIRNAASDGKRDAEIRFTDSDAYSEAYKRLFDNNEINSIITSLNGKYGYKIKSAYKYDNDVMFIIHISLIYDGD